MCLDQSTVLIFVALIGVAGYAVQNWVIKWREFNRRGYIRKEQRYANFVRMLATILSPRTSREGIPDDVKEKLNQEIYLMQLYAPDNVVRAMDKWVTTMNPAVPEDERRSVSQVLLLLMRKDLRKTELEETEMHIYQAK